MIHLGLFLICTAVVIGAISFTFSIIANAFEAGLIWGLLALGAAGVVWGGIFIAVVM